MNIREKMALLKQAAAKVDKKYEKKKQEKEEKRKKAAENLVLPDFISEETEAGPAYFRDNVFPESHNHGGIFVREFRDVPGGVISFLSGDESMADIDLEKALFLDTETTGLAGGTGTVAFLIGVGFIAGGGFVVRQYYMPDYHNEEAILLHLNELMKERPHLVTFNGRTFDMPLIYTRMVMNHMRPAVGGPLHLDLLHPARRFWKKSLDSCRLTSLERNILKFFREDDIPGALIPEMYFQYLRNKDFRPMEKVLEHNLFDIITMASLLVRMWAHTEMAECGNIQPSEHFSMARIYENREDFEKAAFHYEQVFKCGKGQVKKQSGKNLSVIYKKMKDWDRAVPLWEELKEDAGLDIWFHIELAKYYEHHEKDYKKAIEYTEAAFETARKKKNLGAWSVNSEKAEIDHRLNRLRRKSGNP